MENLETRINKLREWRQTVKHLRGQHDQRKHNRWPSGYIAQTYEPVSRRSNLISQRNLVGDSLAMWKRDYGSVQSFDNLPFAINSGTLLNRITNVDMKPAVGIPIPTGIQLADLMSDKKQRPNNILLTKHLMERGYEVEKKLSKNARTRLWGLGEGYFSDLEGTKNPKLSRAEFERKSTQWQRAYIAALQKYTTDAKGKPLPKTNIAEAYAKATDYADHVEHITKSGTPYDMARQMYALGMLRDSSVIGPKGLAGAPGDIGAQEFVLRKLLAVPAKLWEKYKPGTPITDLPYMNDLFTTTQYGNFVDFKDNAYFILDAMSRGDTSIFGYVQNKFPEMSTHLIDVIKQGKQGFEITPIPSPLLSTVTEGDVNTAPKFAPASASEFGTKPAQPVATAPSQINTTDFVYDARTKTMVPRSSAQLAEAIDPGGLITSAIKQTGRGEVNNVNIENLMETARSLAQSTGIPLEIVTTFMTYWQHGSQTVGQYPAPMLVRMQQAAAELFGLQLGENGQQLNAYQEFLMKEALRLTQGGQQLGSSSNDRFMRTYVENLHLFQDYFERNYHTWTDADEMTPIKRAEAPKELAPYMSRLESEWDTYRAEKDKPEPPLTPQERFEFRKKIFDFYQQNQIVPRSVEYIPGTPYRNGQDARKALLKAVYDKTQAMLADAGIKQATLYRSVALTKEQLDVIQDDIRQRTKNKNFTVYNLDGTFNAASLADIDIQLPRNAMESWSYDFHTANTLGASIDTGNPIFDRSTVRSGKEPKGRTIMAELTLATNVDAARIVSTPASGFGQYGEGEIVITGNKGDSVRVAAANGRKAGDKELGYNIWVDQKTGKSKSIAEITKILRERMQLSSAYYWYTGYQGMSMAYTAFREQYIRRRAELIKEATDMGVHR